jgi:hypothetical protein
MSRGAGVQGCWGAWEQGSRFINLVNMKTGELVYLL